MKQESEVRNARALGERVKSREQTEQTGPQRRPLLPGIVVLVVGLLCLHTELAYALRCGNRLILVGASTAEVLDKCGEPVSRDQWVEYRTASPPRSFSFAYPQEQEPVYLPVTIEEWVYNF